MMNEITKARIKTQTENWFRWLIAGFPIMGVNFLAYMLISYFTPHTIAYWAAFIIISPITLLIAQFTMRFGRTSQDDDGLMPKILPEKQKTLDEFSPP